MHVLQVARISRWDVQDRWSRFGFRTSHVPGTQLLPLLSGDLHFRKLTVDVIVFVADRYATDDPRTLTDRMDMAAAINLARRVQKLPDIVAMPDGRKWNAVPMAVLTSPEDLFSTPGPIRYGHGEIEISRADADDIALLPLSPDSNFGANNLRGMVTAYRQKVLSELDHLGFVVTYDAGRYRLGPALRPRAELSGYYYFGQADQRGDHVVTIDRDMIGVQLEVEQFEELINRKGLRERELQVFLEEHPHFLSLFSCAIPHVRLRDPKGKLLVPDLILKPLVAAQRDSSWQVLELKLPDAKLTSGKGTRRRLSHEVWKAITQLREYGAYFADPANEARVNAALGHPLKTPKLAVLIGRSNDREIHAVDAQQAYLTDIRIVTYDEILEQQKVLVQ